MTLLFYDLETTGTNPVFDQICQFAAIRTDECLNELETHECFIRLRPDVIPAPGALVTTRRSIADISTKGEPEYEAVRAIHRLVTVPGTISIGYNSLDFDDDFLRFGFYRNLLSPYDHHWRDGCGRADLLSLVVLYRHFAADLLEWPADDKGPTLRLEAMSVANNCADGQAHDAMSDVRASLNLARRMHARPDLWREGMSSFNGQTFGTVVERLPVVQNLDDGNYRRGVMLRHKFGAAKNYVVPVLLLCWSESYPTTTLWLRLDWADLPAKMMARDWEGLLIRKNKVDQQIVRPPTSPRLSPEAAAQAKANLEWLTGEPTYLSELRDYASSFKWPPIANVDPDASLYSRGFRSPAQDAECRSFHACSLQQKPASVGRFSSSIDRTLATRLLARNYDVCSDDPEYQDYLARAHGEGPCIGYQGRPKRTRQDALAELIELEQSRELDDKQRGILAELRGWLESLS